MKYLKTIILSLFLSCSHTLETDSPYVSLEAVYLTNNSFILKGTTTEECFRGFVISTEPNAIVNGQNNFTYGYDVGVGDYSMAIGVESGKTYYIRAWAMRKGDEKNIGYSIEKSFKTW